MPTAADTRSPSLSTPLGAACPPSAYAARGRRPPAARVTGEEVHPQNIDAMHAVRVGPSRTVHGKEIASQTRTAPAAAHPGGGRPTAPRLRSRNAGELTPTGLGRRHDRTRANIASSSQPAVRLRFGCAVTPQLITAAASSTRKTRASVPAQASGRHECNADSTVAPIDLRPTPAGSRIPATRSDMPSRRPRCRSRAGSHRRPYPFSLSRSTLGGADLLWPACVPTAGAPSESVR